MNRPQRNHNPGNLRFVGQYEATGKDDGEFAVFPNDPAGWRALVRQIKLDQRRGKTIREFISVYAPKHENNTEEYLKGIYAGLSVDPDEELLSSFSPYALAGLVALQEGYFAVEGA